MVVEGVESLLSVHEAVVNQVHNIAQLGEGINLRHVGRSISDDVIDLSEFDIPEI